LPTSTSAASTSTPTATPIDFIVLVSAGTALVVVASVIGFVAYRQSQARDDTERRRSSRRRSSVKPSPSPVYTQPAPPANVYFDEAPPPGPHDYQKMSLAPGYGAPPSPYESGIA